MTVVSLSTFKDYARSEVASADDAILTAALSAADDLVRKFCSRTFTVATGTPTTRSYSPAEPWSTILPIHDCVTVSSVIEYGTALSTSTYQLEPINHLSWAGDWQPYSSIRRFGNYWAYIYGMTKIDVVADWGWQAIPDGVYQATLIIAKDIYQQRNTQSGVAGFGEYGAVRVRMNPIAIDLLQPFKRVEGYGIA